MTSPFDKWRRLGSADVETAKAGLRRLYRFSVYSSRLPRQVNLLRTQGAQDVLFIWIPKAAGTSIYSWLKDEIGMLKLKEPFAVRGGFPGRGPVTFGHMDLSLLVNSGLVEESFVDRAFCFAIVRNPFARARSLFSYLRARGRVEGDLTDFLRNVAQGVEPLGLYNSRGLSQANPQCRWLLRADGRSYANAIWKLEELQEHMSRLRAALGAQGQPEVLNKSPDSSDRLAPRDVDLIRRIYREDFDTFGYSLDPDVRVNNR